MLNTDEGISPEQTDSRGRFITTYSGVKFFIDECNVEDVPIEDIAHSLSMQCRFNGHLKTFYSVAEHSVHICDLILEKYPIAWDLALWGLLHDASEAFVPDLPRPFKVLMSGFGEFEDKAMAAIAEYYQLGSSTMPEEVKYLDTHIVRDEAEKFMINPPTWTDAFESVLDQNWLWGLQPLQAKTLFISRFEFLQSKRSCITLSTG